MTRLPPNAPHPQKPEWMATRASGPAVLGCPGISPGERGLDVASRLGRRLGNDAPATQRWVDSRGHDQGLGLARREWLEADVRADQDLCFGGHVSSAAVERMIHAGYATRSGGTLCRMRPLRYSINVTLDGCCDHREGIADEDIHRHAAENLYQADALLFGRVTYEMMEAAWRQTAP